MDAYLTNIPKNAGELSFYVFSIPARPNVESVKEVQLYFPRSYRNFAPKTFAYEIGSNIQCGVYTTLFQEENFLKYKSLVTLFAKGSSSSDTSGGKTNGFNGIFYPIKCSITSERVLTLKDLPAVLIPKIQTHWLHWIIKNVNNPSLYVSGEFFKIIYQSG